METKERWQDVGCGWGTPHPNVSADLPPCKASRLPSLFPLLFLSCACAITALPLIPPFCYFSSGEHVKRTRKQMEDACCKTKHPGFDRDRDVVSLMLVVCCRVSLLAVLSYSDEQDTGRLNIMFIATVSQWGQIQMVNVVLGSVRRRMRSCNLLATVPYGALSCRPGPASPLSPS